jgi:hypothetical protein
VLGCALRGISFEAGTAGYGVEVFTICGNVISGGGSNAIPLYLEGGYYGSVTGNSCSAGSGAPALYVDGSQAMRYSGNMLYSGSSRTVSATGTCTGSVFDESNFVNRAVDNGATGLNVRQIASARLPGWTLQVGDVIHNAAGSSPFAWQWSGSGWLSVAES